MNQIFILQMQSEDDGSFSWDLEKGRVAYGQIEAVSAPVRIQAVGVETFILPAKMDARVFFETLFHDRGVKDSETVWTILFNADLVGLEA